MTIRLHSRYLLLSAFTLLQIFNFHQMRCLESSLKGNKVSSEAETTVPGYLGNAYKRARRRARTILSTEFDSKKVIELSAWAPRAYLYKNFLTDAECDHIRQRAEPRLERSTVVDSVDANSEVSEIRTSWGMFMDKAEDEVIKRVEERIAKWTFLPVENQEEMQVLKYMKGQKYVPHVDYFSDPPEKQRGGQRYATVLMYLSNTTKGGETVFSNAPDPTPKDDTWSECAKGFLAVKPRKGDALLFFSMHPDGSPDPYSMHYACPVVEGIKWSAPKWIHVREFEPTSTVGDPTLCENKNELCDLWANNGECVKNKNYMIGRGRSVGACRKACKACPGSSPASAL